MTEPAPFVAQNQRERERLRALVAELDDDRLLLPVSADWTIAAVLGHIAFWDAHVLALGRKLQRGVALTPEDDEPEDVDWVNDAAAVVFQAIEPRLVAELAMGLATETDELVASLPAERMYPADPESPLNALRATHRGEHLDQIESALRTSATP